jgi:Protein of unknown function (DUF2934)
MQNPTRRQTRFDRTAAEVSAQSNSEEEIRRRAYELYEARGRGDGHDLEDWLEAETEITGRAESAAA